MGVIQGHAELLESSVGDDQGRERLRTIREQVDRIAHIIQTLLNMARPSARQLGPVDLRAVLRETLAFLVEKLRAHSVEAAVDLGATVVVARRPRQAAAARSSISCSTRSIAMPGGGKLSVSLSTPRPEQAEIRISDTGCGIPSEALERIFEPFFTTKPAGRGSGLGLVVVRGIVSDHGGAISVSSRPGAGTTFVLTFSTLEA